MNGLVIQTDRTVNPKFPVWTVKYLTENMSGADLLYRARSLQSNGELNCYEYWFSRRYHLYQAIKEFILMRFLPFDPELPLCPAADVHSRMKGAEGIFICHQSDPTDLKEDVRGMWMIMRTIGVLGKGNTAKRQFLDLTKPIPIWLNAPVVTNSRDVLLTATQKLIISSPNFADSLTRG